MATFTLTLQNVDSHWYTETYAAETKSFTITYYWPDQIQEQYDRVALIFQKAAASNPLIDNRGHVTRSYDFVDILQNGSDTYTLASHPGETDTFNNWRTYTTAEFQEAITYYEHLSECLAWNISINDGTNVYTSAIRGGGSVSALDGSWTMTFTTSRVDDTIGVDDLETVTMTVEIPDA